MSYQVIGRGDIIITNTLEIPNSKSHTFSFLASFAMVPKAQVIVHYIKDDAIISDKLEIEFADDLQNFVSCTIFKKNFFRFYEYLIFFFLFVRF